VLVGTIFTSSLNKVVQALGEKWDEVELVPTNAAEAFLIA